MQVPMNLTQNIQGGAPALYSGGQVATMKDTVSGATAKLAQAQSKAGQEFNAIRDEFQLARDDAVFKKAHADFAKEANEIKFKYLALESEGAVRTVGTNPDTNQPISILDQQKNDIEAIRQQYLGNLENSRQIEAFDIKSGATKETISNRMGVHYISENSKFLKNSAIADIATQTKEAGENYKDFFDLNGEYNASLTAALQLQTKEDNRIGLSPDSPIRKNNMLQVWNSVQSAALDTMIAEGDFKTAFAFLERNYNQLNKMSPATFKTYNEIVKKGYKKQVGEKQATNIFNYRGNPNSDDPLSKINFTFLLSSNHAADDGRNAPTTNGLNALDGQNPDLSDTEASEYWFNASKESKFFNEETGVMKIIPEHQTMQLFAIQTLGVEKADSIFTKAKTLSGKDASNEDIMKNVVKLFKEAQEKKFFANGEHVDLVNKDIDTILKYIDYDYANKVIAGGKDGLFNDRNDESGMPKRTDMLELLNDVIIDDEKLEYAKTEFKKVYDDQESINEGEYKNLKEEIFATAFAKEGGYADVNEGDFAKLTREDQRIAKNGHPENSITDIYKMLLQNPTETLPENLGKYRGQLSKADYRKFLVEGEKIKSGGEKKVIAVSGDVTMLHNTMNKYNLQKLYKAKKGNKNNQSYIAIQQAWHEEINYMQEMLGRKVTYSEKENALEKILIDNVNVDNRDEKFLGIFGGFTNYDRNVYFEVDNDDMDDIFVEVTTSEGESVNIYPSEIDSDEVVPLISAALRSNGRPATQTNIAQMWVEFGRPKNKADAIKYNEELEALAEK